MGNGKQVTQKILPGMGDINKKLVWINTPPRAGGKRRWWAVNNYNLLSKVHG